MQSSRMRTARSSSHLLGVVVSASLHVGIHPLRGVGLETPPPMCGPGGPPPGQTPQPIPLGVGLETPQARPLDLPLGVGLETPP